MEVQRRCSAVDSGVRMTIAAVGEQSVLQTLSAEELEGASLVVPCSEVESLP